MATRLQIAKKDIVNVFETDSKKIWKYSEVGEILKKNRTNWRLANSTSVSSFIKYLLDNTQLKKIRFDFPFRRETRYAWGNLSTYDILMNLNSKSYFSHYTAMLLNDLTEQIPKTIYLNLEQRIKPSPANSNLEQTNIDRAFSNKPRITNNYTVYKKNRVYLLSGKNSGNLGVNEVKDSDNSLIRVTNIERTLIDITVRPVYSGGVNEVLGAYKKAKGKVSINKLMSYLYKLNYIYPYHQAIGFYLEKAKYSENLLALVEQIPMKNNFYLDYQIENPNYSTRWKLYYPDWM